MTHVTTLPGSHQEGRPAENYSRVRVRKSGSRAREDSRVLSSRVRASLSGSRVIFREPGTRESSGSRVESKKPARRELILSGKVKNYYPLLLISEILDRLLRAKKFSKIDVREAYYRISIKEGDE
ncbi:hypothetical protein PDE_07107 [Penicillium oxalicum 114-2]|uniref:Reverse transcriptase domain-containing protein n=1 Tax=Penicillium oxalicum (strain 114-2 / CGMCC 5302) TaxID=933388 RepID=S8B079_PENO1|nr:hypothetical protein PDE_07107 [Penicillium oxalicum 114-2]